MIDLARANGALDSLGGALVARFGALNVATAALLCAALGIDRLLSRRARASWRIALYAPIALRVAIPPSFRLPIPHAPRLEQVLAAPLPLFDAPASAASSPASGVPWHLLAVAVYVAVGALLVARVVVARVRLGRALAHALPWPRPGLPCPVVVHEELGPMAVGLLAPRIVLPRRLLAPERAEALDCVLCHEAAHVRRRDAWLSAAMQLLAVAAWPVAPVWIAAARVRHLIELACDEAALAGADATERRRYGHALLDLSGWGALAVAPAGAGELHFGSTLRERIEALALPRRWPIAAQAVALTAASMALVGASTAIAAPPPAPEDTRYGYVNEVDPATRVAASAEVTSVARDPEDRVPPTAVQQVVRAHYGAFTRCYDAGVARDATLAGTVTVKAVIGADGEAERAADEGSTLPDGEVVACIVDAFGAIAYPAGEGELTFVYTMRFKP